jgi:putative CocE/NonD family hydrolase
MLIKLFATAAIAALTFCATCPAAAQTSDIPEHFQPNTATFDYIKRDVMIPMRDGVKLHTVIVLPKGARNAPILLDRTPYGAATHTNRTQSPHGAAVLSEAYGQLFTAGYIVVIQDVRGKHGSEGDYINERPLRGPLNTTKTDHATDAFDTIDWLVKNTPESNGRVGMIGVSYDGMMVLMALCDPHPALKAAVPINPVANTWKNDDDFHGGAFRLIGFDYYHSQDTERGEGADLWRPGYDDYDTFLKAGSAGDFMKAYGIDQLPFPARMAQHPAYDDFWKAQALDEILATRPLKVPTLHVASQWDQEDSYGAVATYKAMEAMDTANDTNFLAIGPWSHGGSMKDGSSLGDIKFDGDPSLKFRRDILIPWLDQRLKTSAPPASIAPVIAYATGAGVWRSYTAWPPKEASARPIYLQSDGGLAFGKPEPALPLLGRKPGYDEYVSDPAKPVPYRLRPIRPTYAEGSTWSQWLVDDQRVFSDRTDVLVYATAPLTEPVEIAGAPVAHLYASTTGTDADWVVKLIDAYPDEDPLEAKMGGYQLPIAMDILRGRYRKGYDHPEPVSPGKIERYDVALPNAHHVFLPGHRIMVQIQSSWFPLYDRNPQTYVENIFFAQPSDYRKATQRIFHTAGEASNVELPIVSVTESAAR